MKTEELANEISQMQTRLAEIEQELIKESEGELEEGQYRFCSANKGAYRINKKVDHYRYEILWLCKMDVIDNTEEVNKISMEGDRILSDDEIKEALVAEAKRRGLWPGNCSNNSKIIGAKVNDFKIPHDRELVYDKTRDALYYKVEEKVYDVYVGGQWAEKIDDTITINGVECLVGEHFINLSCGGSVHIGGFRNFFEIIHEYDLTVHRQGEDITPQIKKLGEQI